MRWIIMVHCLCPTRFWAEADLLGAVISDAGAVKVCADKSPQSDSPRCRLVCQRKGGNPLVDVSAAARQATVLADLARYFGETALHTPRS